MDTDSIARHNAWARATDIVAQRLDGGVTFEYPGIIYVQVTPSVALAFGTANETIDANVERDDGTGLFVPEDYVPECLVSDVPSDTLDHDLIADTVERAVRAYGIPRECASPGCPRIATCSGGVLGGDAEHFCGYHMQHGA